MYKQGRLLGRGTLVDGKPNSRVYHRTLSQHDTGDGELLLHTEEVRHEQESQLSERCVTCVTLSLGVAFVI